jgi:fatty acid desaturase
VEPEYALLRSRVLDAGLLDRRYASYAVVAAAAFGILACGLALTNLAPAVAAMLIAIGSVQVALVGHDAGHLAIFKSHAANRRAAQVCWSLTLGVCFAYWHDRHSRHHASPNHIDTDPDVQWEYGPALVPLMAFTLRLDGWRYALRHGCRTELGMLVASSVGWLAFVMLLGISALPTLIASQLLASVYLALVVAPNHIGMPTWSTSGQSNFLELQLRSSRNLLPHPIADLFFGGLNYQIEHHIFPSMPRSNLPKARELVKPFCLANGLPYTEQNVLEVYRDVLRALPKIT